MHTKIETASENLNRLIQLENKLPPELLHLSNINGVNYWDKVDEKNFGFFIRQCVGRPWANHIAIALLCLTDRNLSPASIMNILTVINARLRDLFNVYELTTMDDLTPLHIEKYVTKQVLLDHSDRQRQTMLTYYGSIVFNLKKWLGSQFDPDQFEQLSKYNYPNLPFDNRDFVVREKAITSAKTKRKEDTSAVTPLLPEIRAEGHLRWNQVSRLREVFKSTVAKVRSEQLPLPLDFNYDETEYAGERWFFKLVDLKRNASSQDPRGVYRSFQDEDVVLEFIKAEKLEDGSVGDGPWFLELLKMRLLGNWYTKYTSDEQKERNIEYLNQWGYEIEEGGAIPAPFLTRNTGLLTQGFETTRIARLTNKLLINIEPIYAACMFAKFALDIITSSGARMNELLQISYDRECCIVTEDKNVNPPKKNFLFRLIPKGREEPENFYMPEDVFKFMTEILQMLKETYASKTIPEV